MIPPFAFAFLLPFVKHQSGATYDQHLLLTVYILYTLTSFCNGFWGLILLVNENNILLVLTYYLYIDKERKEKQSSKQAEVRTSKLALFTFSYVCPPFTSFPPKENTSIW